MLQPAPALPLNKEKIYKLLGFANAPVELRHVEFEGDAVRFEVRSARGITLRVGDGEPEKYPAGLQRGRGRIQKSL